MNLSLTDPTLEAMLTKIQDEGVESQREQLLLWVLRNQYEISPEDSYEFVLEPMDLFPGTPVDAAFVSDRRDVLSPVYVLLDGQQASLKARVRALSMALAEEDAPEVRLTRTSARLRSIFGPAVSKETREIHRIILAVCTEQLTPARTAGIRDTSAMSDIEVSVLDLSFLRALAEAESDPTSSMPGVRIQAASNSVLDLQIPSSRGIVLPITAREIALWPGIENRSLFDLNVRHALGFNRVRRSLDAALTDSAGADEFIAYHNGITAVCRSFTQDELGITVEGISVVNGAQTVVAIHSNRHSLPATARVLLKLIEADSSTELARNIAIRSNTQNPVTSRNLRALDAIQERLKTDAAKFGYAYLVRPDDKLPTSAKAIRNDDVAQLLCSIYVRKPALAVKRQVLFENPQYKEIFPESLDIARVILAHTTRQSVELQRDRVPQLYRKAWALTSLTLVFMASEAMRADPVMSKVLELPGDRIRNADLLRRDIEPYVIMACEVLSARYNSVTRFGEMDESDDFKVAFKHTRTLNDLGLETARMSRSSFRGER